jgi:hypothetical protein
MALEQGSMVDLTLLEFSPTLRYGLLLLIVIRMVLKLREEQNNRFIIPAQSHFSYAAFVHLASYFAVLAQLAASGTFETSRVIPIIICIAALGFIIYWQLSPQAYLYWMPLTFLAIALISTLQNNTYAVLAWGMTFILFAFFIEVFPSFHRAVEKWNIIPTLLVALVFPFTPLWVNSPLTVLTASTPPHFPFTQWATIAFLFLIQIISLFIITRQMQQLTSFWGNPLKDIPSTVISISIWAIYFLSGVWISFYNPLPPLWISLPYVLALLFLYLGIKLPSAYVFSIKKKSLL